jgi:S-adenosylmethionine-diacylglycerol 3-amino-3-carboxypropyl transferase
VAYLRQPLTAGRLFDLVHRHNLVYNQCWEDPAVDHAALGLGSQDRVLVITSAGCNALDYALSGARIVAVDANPRQNHLLELKLAGIRRLSFEEFFALFGDGGSERAGDIYQKLRPVLSPLAQRFWDRRISLFVPSRARGGSFYYSGTSGLVALGVRRYVERRSSREVVRRLLAAPSIDEQIELYRTGLRRALLHPLFLRLTGTKGVLSFLGVPEAQRHLVESHDGGFAGFLEACLERVLSVALLRDNYFWLVYLTGGYTRRACPSYLRRESFEQLKGGLVDNVTVRTATVTAQLAVEQEAFTAFVLLDHMDWLARRRDQLEEEWRQIEGRAAPGARIIFRSGAADATFLPESVRGRLNFDVERAAALHQLDRVGTYGSFHLARMAH